MADVPPVTPTGYLVYYHHPMRGFAEQFIEAGKEKGRNFCKKEITWSKFEGGMPNIFIHDIEQARCRHILFFGSFTSYEEMSFQLDVIYVFTRSLVASLTVVLPYWPVGTMERVIKEGEVATADIWAWHFSKLPLTAGGPTRVIVYAVHALPNRFFFHDGAIVSLLSGVPLLIAELEKEKAKNGTEIAIAFPDAGACKRFGTMFPGFELITCEKVRDGNTRIVRIAEGNPSGKICVIVDDLVRSGGTLLECRGGLLKAGAVGVSAYCTHADFDQGKRITRFLEEKSFDNFYLTDSNPQVTNLINGKGPFKILSLAASLVDYV